MNETNIGVRVGATPEPLTEAWFFEWLANVGWIPASYEAVGARRLFDAIAALRAPEPLTADMLADAFMAGAAWREQGEESEAETEKTAKSYARAALEGGVSPQPSSSEHLTESAGEVVQRPAFPVPASWETRALSTAQKIALMWGQDRSQFVSKIQIAVLDAMRWAGYGNFTDTQRPSSGARSDKTEIEGGVSRTEPALTDWLRNNMTFYDTAEQTVPTLASVSKRIWYHATDDTENYPFDSVIARALVAAKGQS